MRPRAKAKVRKARSVAQKELETNSAPPEIVVSDEKKAGRVKTIDTGELKNVIATTVQRVYQEEYGINVNDATAREQIAQLIVMTMKYGEFDEYGYLRQTGGIKMRDHDFSPVPLCKEHR
jgi:hypothetical protein